MVRDTAAPEPVAVSGEADRFAAVPELAMPSLKLPFDELCAIRNVLALRWVDHPEGARSLAVVSPRRSDGRSVLAANLAANFAEAGYSTLLIDADLREPSQHALFGIGQGPGLGEFLSASPNTLPRVQISTNLALLPAGTAAGETHNLLLGRELETLFRLAREEFQVVISDTPAARSGPDFQIVAAQAIGALVLLRQDRTRIAEARTLVKECGSFGVRVVGSVIVPDHGIW